MDSSAPRKTTVSVVVPIYNVEDYLRTCLDSLLDQKLEGLEVILVNDGSKDGSGEIAKEYAEKHPALFRYVEEENSGLSAARNYGVTFAKGEYIAFVDSDDFVAPDIYRKMYEAGKRDDSDMVCCAYNRVRSRDLKPMVKYRFHAMHHSGHSVAEYPSLLSECSCFAWNKLYRPFLLQRLPFPVGQKYEDSAVTYSMMGLCNRITLVNEVGYYYRDQRAGSISAEPKSFIEIFKSMESMRRFYEEEGKAEDYRRELEYICYRHLLSKTRTKQLMNGKLSFAWKYLNMAYGYLWKHYRGWNNNPYILTDSPWTTPKWEGRRIFFRNRLFFFGRVALGKYLLKRKARKDDEADEAQTEMIPEVPEAGKKDNYTLPKETLLDIQSIQRSILNTIHRFCEENGLTYYADEGSLLGAVRHEGFIPWDDDMDLAMPREDYEKFIALWGKQTIDGRILLASETREDYYLPFIKIIEFENVKYRATKRKVPPELQGSSIDIFPLDETAAFDSIKEVRRLRKIRRVRDMMLYKKGSIGSRFRKLNCVLHFVHLRSMPSLQLELKKLLTKYRGQDVPYLANLCSSYIPKFEVFPKEWWGESVTGRFDDTVIKLPQQPDYILSTIYGAYREFPPERRQVCKHHYEVVKK